jgi:hypothetical protein
MNPDPVLNAYFPRIAGISINNIPSNRQQRARNMYYPIIKFQIRLDKLKRQLLYLHERKQQERNVQKKRNLQAKYNKLKRNIATLEAGNNENVENYYNTMLERIYNSAQRISPLYTSNNPRMPVFRPNAWRLNDFSKTHKIPQNYVRRLLLGQNPSNIANTPEKRKYINALKNTVMRRIVAAQKKFNRQRAQRAANMLSSTRLLGSLLPASIVGKHISPHLKLKRA